MVRGCPSFLLVSVHQIQAPALDFVSAVRILRLRVGSGLDAANGHRMSGRQSPESTGVLGTRLGFLVPHCSQRWLPICCPDRIKPVFPVFIHG